MEGKFFNLCRTISAGFRIPSCAESRGERAEGPAASCRLSKILKSRTNLQPFKGVTLDPIKNHIEFVPKCVNLSHAQFGAPRVAVEIKMEHCMNG
jgi:hypothetical protein